MFYVANIYWNINRNKNHFHYNIQHLFQDHLWSLASRYVTVGVSGDDGASVLAHRLVEFRVSKWSNFLMLLLFLLHSLHLLLGRIIEILCLAKIECSKIAKRFYLFFVLVLVLCSGGFRKVLEFFFLFWVAGQSLGMWTNEMCFVTLYRTTFCAIWRCSSHSGGSSDQNDDDDL